MSNNNDDEEKLPQREDKDTPLISVHTDLIIPPSTTENENYLLSTGNTGLQATGVQNGAQNVT